MPSKPGPLWPGTEARPWSRRPRIGITLMQDDDERGTHIGRYGMNRTYFEAIRAAGGIPVPLVPGAPEEMELFLPVDGLRSGLREAGAALDGLCLSGGGDPDPALYGQARRPRCGRPDAERDAMEMELLGRVRRRATPLFAICRGIQMLNVAWGGTLIQDIASERPAARNHWYAPSDGFSRQHPAHAIDPVGGSRIARLLGSGACVVNSIHHQAIDRLAPGLRATAHAQDGLIEAVEGDRDAYILGVQFHPEDLLARADMRRLFQDFAAAAAASRARRVAAPDALG